MMRRSVVLLVMVSVGHVHAAEAKPQLLLPLGHTESVECVAWSPDGQRILTASKDKTIRVWDVKSGLCLKTLTGHKEEVVAVAWSPDGKQALSGEFGSNASARIWDLSTGKTLHTLNGHAESVRILAWSPDGKQVLTSDGRKLIRLWDAASGKHALDITRTESWVRSATWSPDGKRILTGWYDNSARIWDAVHGKLLHTLKLPISSDLVQLQWSPNGKRLLASNRENRVFLLDAESARVLLTFPEKGELRNGLAWSPDGKRVVTKSYWNYKSVTIWDAETGKALFQLTGHTSTATSAAWSPDGKILVTGSLDQTARLWDTATGKEMLQLGAKTQPVHRVAWRPDGKRLLTACYDKTARVWDLETGRSLLTLLEEQSWVNAVAWSPRGDRLVTASTPSVYLWDAETGQRVSRLFTDTSHVYGLAWSPDGTAIVAAGGKVPHVLDPRTGQVIRKLTGHTDSVTSVAWSPDGKWLLTGSHDNTTRIWNASTGNETWKSPNFFAYMVTSVAWSPDSKRILCGSLGDSVIRCDALLGINKLELREHSSVVTSVAYSADGKHLLSGSWDATVRLWDASSGKNLQTFTAHLSRVQSVAFAPQGRFFATGSDDGTTRVWKLGRLDPVYSYLHVGDDWLAWTPEGYYHGSPGAEKLIAWKIDDSDSPGGYRIVGPDQFRKTFHRPDLFAHLLSEPDLDKALAKADKLRGKEVSMVSSIAEQLPPVVIIAQPLQARSVVQGDRCEISVKARGIGDNHVSALQLLVGGRPYNGGRARFQIPNPRAGEASARWTIDLTPGETTVQVVAESIKGSRSRPEEAQVVIVREERRVELPTLFLLGVGVSDYTRVDKRGVEHCGSDAQRFLKAQSKHGKPLYNKVEQIALTDGKASKADLLDAFDELSKKARSVPRAVVMIFLAGHGKLSELGDFYFLTADSDAKRLRATALSAAELKNALKDIPGRVILYLDACHSGAFAGDSTRSTGLTDDLVSELTGPECGVVVVSSSRGKELSGQSSDHAAGYFTLALEEALSGKSVPFKGGKPGETYAVTRATNGAVYLPELFAFVNRRVKELSDGQQNPYASELKKVGELPLTRP